MATGAKYSVKFRRRRELLTDYKKRLAIAKSGLPRLVVRKSGTGMTVQVVEFLHTTSGDRTIATAVSQELRKKFGWKAGCGNLPAAYLTGLLLGRKAAGELGTKKLILDIGRQHPAPGGRLFAALKGAVDGGLKVECAPEVFPDEKRLRGEHISSCHSKLGRGFTAYGIEPAKMQEHFEEVRNNISKLEVSEK